MALPGVDLAAVEAEVSRQCDALPRGDVARQALAHSCIVVARDQARGLWSSLNSTHGRALAAVTV